MRRKQNMTNEILFISELISGARFWVDDSALTSSSLWAAGTEYLGPQCARVLSGEGEVASECTENTWSPSSSTTSQWIMVNNNKMCHLRFLNHTHCIGIADDL